MVKISLKTIQNKKIISPKASKLRSKSQKKNNIVNTTNALKTLFAQLKDMQLGHTKLVYQLASPANRQFTALGGYNYLAFDKMVKNPQYQPLLNCYQFRIIGSQQQDDQYVALVEITPTEGSSQKLQYQFSMSLQGSEVIDEHSSLGDYKLLPGHRPVWRTDSVMLK